ncbi:ATPase [Escherichia coli]
MNKLESLPHHFIMMSLVSGEHNTPALSLQDESPGLVPAG